MMRYATLLFLIALGLYGAFKLTPLLSGPSITLSTPAPFETVSGRTLVISGVARHTEKLTLNGALLPIDAEGAFQKALTMPTGGAILSLTATDRFGKETNIVREVYVQE